LITGMEELSAPKPVPYRMNLYTPFPLSPLRQIRSSGSSRPVWRLLMIVLPLFSGRNNYHPFVKPITGVLSRLQSFASGFTIFLKMEVYIIYGPPGRQVVRNAQRG